MNIMLTNGEEILQMTAWGVNTIDRLVARIQPSQCYKFINVKIRDGNKYNWGTLPYTLIFGIGSYVMPNNEVVSEEKNDKAIVVQKDKPGAAENPEGKTQVIIVINLI